MVIIKARVLRQAVSARPVNNLKIIRKKPSLGRVAVSVIPLDNFPPQAYNTFIETSNDGNLPGSAAQRGRAKGCKRACEADR